MTASVRVLIADDHDLIRQGLRTVVESHDGWTVCAEAADGREAVRLAEETHPDVAVLDLTMPGLNGLEATRRIRQSIPHCEVLILTMHHSEQLIHEVLSAGARAYVLKSDAGNAIADAIESLCRGQPYFTSRVSEVLLEAYLDPHKRLSETGGLAVLTPREREITQLIGEGHSGKEIAVLLGISEKTAETHRTNLMRKIGVHSVSELVRYAIRNNIIEP